MLLTIKPDKFFEELKEDKKPHTPDQDLELGSVFFRLVNVLGF